MKLNYKRTIFVGFAFFLISAFWQAYDAIVPLILTNHFGLPQTASGVVMSLDNILAVVLLPVFGAISDRVMTRYGRRTPFIVIGAIAAIATFICLAAIDAHQLSAVFKTDIPDLYAAAKEELKLANEHLIEMGNSGNHYELEIAKAWVAEAEAEIEMLTQATLNITLGNIMPLVGFIGMLLVVLISMAIFRSPAVALMPDVTVKPLRSKANAIINLMGTAGGILVLALGMLFKTSNKHHMSYVGYVLAVCGIMLLGLVLFIATVKERKWADEMEKETERLGIDKTADGDTAGGKLSRPELRSLFLILASVALWYIGYNSITSKYSVYASNELFFDFNSTLIIAQIAAIISYIPVGIIASKIGRRKTILAGILMLGTAFLCGNFISAGMNQYIMLPIFVLAGMGWATINVNSFPMVVELAKGGDVGKYTGYYYTASMAAQIVAPIFSGILYDAYGMRSTFFSFGTVFVALSFVTMFFVKHGDAKPTAQSVIEDGLGGDD